MKKPLLAVGLAVVAAAALMPGNVSAHDYNNEDWNTNHCERLTERLEHLNSKFDQDKDHRLERIQRIVDRQKELNCPVSGNIVETLVQNGNFTTLVSAVQAAGLADALSAAGDKTVFAPTDQAFASLPEGTVETLLADIPALTNILTYHVVSGAVDAEAAAQLESAAALNGSELRISTDDCGDLYINDAKVVISDIPTTNGVIHVVNTVLIP